ncbi:MAG: HPr kinase/phosphatase C-terminal domain-containing protein [Hyphomicrobiaceae bacterium]
MDGATTLVHGTCIALESGAAILQGPSGAGKSDLALRCIMQPAHINGRPLAARLVADDQVMLERRAASLWARPPATIAGKLEVRGLGIVDVPHAPEAQVRLVVQLVGPGDRIERLPQLAEVGMLGVMLPVVQVAPFEASAPLKVLLALLQASR